MENGKTVACPLWRNECKRQGESRNEGQVEVETQQHEGGCVRWNSNKSIKRKPCSWRTKVRWPVGGDLGCVILIHETDAPLESRGREHAHSRR
jgi:hypothetical protein